MINFNLVFETNADGFTPSQAQQDAMNLAASNWGSIFGNVATIDLLIESSFDANGDGLMSAGSSFVELSNPGFGNVAIPPNKILTGNDLNGAVGAGGSDNGYDGVIEVNWGVNWELDINETPNLAEDEFDFYSTFYHEMTHIMGFDTTISRLNNADPDVYVDIFDEGDETPGSWTRFDQFLTDSDGTAVINPNTNQIDSDTFDDLVTGGSSADGTSGLFFSGPNAVAANNGAPVGLFSPATYSSSSSIIHLDDDNPAFAGALTLAAVDAGPAARSLNAVEQGIFTDLGYTVLRSDIVPAPAPTPEPAPTPTPEPTPAPNPEPTPTLMLVDFDAANGNSLAAGTVITEQFAGITISTPNSPFGAMLFDSESPTGGDFDLRTSNQGNVLIISEDGDSTNPDDNATGGTLRFDFDAPTDLSSVSLLDLESPGNRIDLFAADGDLIRSIDVVAAGDNQQQSVDLDAEDVSRLEIFFVNSGAVTSIAMSEASNTGSSSDDDLLIGLYDAGTDQLVQVLEDGDSLAASSLDLDDLNVAAFVPDSSAFSGQVESMQVLLNGAAATSFFENVEPYALFGDALGDFFQGSLPTGRNTIAFELYSEDNGQGELLATIERNFTIL